MSNLGPQHINLSFGGLLQLPNGASSSLATVQDGAGNATALEVSTTAVDFPIESPTGGASGMISDLATDAGSSFVGFEQAGTGAVTRSVQDKARETVSVLDFGADPTGVVDSSPAIQAATNTGKTVKFPDGVYKMLSDVTYTGKVTWVGNGQNSRILSDSVVLTVTDGSGSSIDNLYAENITAPWIITRDPSNWTAVPTPVQSNADGYQPTANDADIWSSLTPAQQNQDIGPQFVFDGEATGVKISRIYGRFVSIILYNCSNSTVYDCDFRAGKNFAAGIVFWNMDGTKSPGYMNQAINNTVRYPSYCGITFARNYDGLVQGNQIEYAGESGIKTYQDIVGGVQAYCYRMQILGNYTKYNYFDGFDLQAQQALVGVIDTRYNVADNSTFGNYRTGFIMDGRNCLFANNYSRATGLTGMKLVIPYSLIQGNTVYDANQLNIVSGEHQLLIGGDYISITGNYTNQGVTNGIGIYAEGQNLVSGNTTIGSGAFLGVSGSITARTYGNQFGTTASVTTNTMSSQTRQNDTAVPASLLYSETTTFNNVDEIFHPKKNLLANPIGRISGEVTIPTSGAEAGRLKISAAYNGALRDGVWLIADRETYSSITFPLRTSIPDTTYDLYNGSYSFWVDEGANQLKVAVKYTTGVVKTSVLILT